MKQVWVALLKCPENHSILAGAGVYESETEARGLERMVLQEFDRLVREGKLNRECGICKGTRLDIHLVQTRFKTGLEAEPFLRQTEGVQRASAEWLRRSEN